MSREIRRVPADWEHPKDEYGRDIPKIDGSYAAEVVQWDEAAAKFEEGLVRDYVNGGWQPKNPKYAHPDDTFEDYSGERPKPEWYMPDWPEAERTHYQMYESVSEGTPISPVFATPEEVAGWLADNNASAFASQTASYEAWLKVAKGSRPPSAVMENGVMMSGVEALS